MILNRLEYHLVTSRLRDWHLEREVRRLRSLSDLPAGARILEIGCGKGLGARWIRRLFEAREVVGVDLDERMIGLARRMVREPGIRFEVGDAANLRFPDASFDAVFDFGVLHHIPRWRNALVEIRRVLKPEGRLVIEDLSLETFEVGVGKLLKPLLSHPYQDMYRWPEFLKALEDVGFRIQREATANPAFLFRYFIVLARKGPLQKRARLSRKRRLHAS